MRREPSARYPELMRIRGAVAVGFACVAMAVAPALAIGQSAGDDQYVDPLSGATGGGSGSGSNGSESTAGSAGSGSSSGSGSGATGLPGELARTGVELPLAAGAGVLLLAGGLGLRRFSGVRS